MLGILGGFFSTRPGEILFWTVGRSLKALKEKENYWE
jgi:hypothetical protein